MLSAAVLPAQAVLEIAAEEVCWTNNSVETSLTRYVLLSSRTPSSSQVIAYVDATGAIVDPTVGGTITLGYCGCCNEAGGGDDDWRYYYPNSPTNTNPIWRYGRVVIGNVSTPDTSHVLQLYGNFEFKPDTTFTRLSWPIQETGKNTPYYGLLLESSAGETGTSFAGGRNHFTIATHNTVFEKTRLGALAFAGNNPNDTDLKLSAFLEAAANGAWSSTNTGSNITVYVTQNNTLTPHAVASFAHDGRFQLGKYANFNDGVPTSLIGHQTGTSNLSRHPIAGTAGAGKVPAINASNTGLEWITPSGGGGISDGNKGDITVSNSGATFTINNGVVSNAKLAADAVTADKIAADAVTSDKIAAGAVQESDIGTGAVTAGKIGTGAVGATQLASTGVTAGTYTYPSITVDEDGRLTAASTPVAPLTGSSSASNVAVYSSSNVLSGSNTFTFSTSGLGILSVNAAATFNDAGEARNFRIESDLNDNMFLLDGTNNNIGINTSTPAATSLVDMTSTTRGLLIPRMTTTQRDAITSPASGLMIYNTTTQTIDTYNGTTSAWVSLGGGGSLTDGNKGDITVSSSGTVWDINTGVVGDNELASTTVVAGVYRAPAVNINQDGRVTSATQGVQLPTSSVPVANAVTFDLENAFIANRTVNMSSMTGTLTLTVNNPASGGVYTFRFSSAAGKAIDFPSSFILPNGTALDGGTVYSLTVDIIVQAVFNGTQFVCNVATGIPGSGGGGTPAGSTGQIQYNNAGAFGASANLFWDITDSELGVGTATPAARIHAVGAGTTSATDALLLEASDNIDLLEIRNDGVALFGRSRASGVTQNSAMLGVGSTVDTAVNFVLTPKSSGALIFGEAPDGTPKGGNARGVGAVDLQNYRRQATGFQTRVASGTMSVITGGVSNTASGTESVVSGGRENVASGLQSVVAGGIGNTASGDASFAFGNRNTASWLFTFAGGTNCVASGTGSFAFGNNVTSNATGAISLGRDITNSALHGFASGFRGNASLSAQRIHANDYFTHNGDWQTSDLRIARSVTGTGQFELFLNVGATERMIIPIASGTTTKVWNARIQCIGTVSNPGNGSVTTGETIAQSFDCAIRRTGTTTVLVGAVLAGLDVKDTNMSTAAFTVDADDTNEALRVRFTAPTASGSTTVIRTGCTVYLTEIGF